MMDEVPPGHACHPQLHRRLCDPRYRRGIRFAPIGNGAEPAVFCGHVHVPHAGAINTRARYVGGPGFAGGRPPVELRPL